MRIKLANFILKISQIDNLVKAFFIVGVGLLITIALLVSYIGKANSTADTTKSVANNTKNLTVLVKKEAKSQLINRAINVESWCGGINEGRSYDRNFVKRVTQGKVTYTLTDKDCEAIIRRTLESPKRHQAVTSKNYPLTFKVLQELGIK